MPCIVKVRINGAKLNSVSDPHYISLSFGPFPTNHTTSTHQYDDFRYEVSDDSLLQDHPLQFTVFSAIQQEQIIGSVNVDLNPLLAVDSPYSLSGTFPLHHPDNPHPIGQLSIQCRLQFFGDFNPFKESSAGVQFFTHPGIPRRHAALIGLVDMELTVLSPRDHDTLSTLIVEQSGQLKRLMGRKVLEMGGNAVLAFKQHVDFEESAGLITLRGLGTASKLFNDDDDDDCGEDTADGPRESLQSPTNSIDLMTITLMPAQTVLSMGGLVTAKSVKALTKSNNSLLERQQERERWLNQLREEIKTHCRTLNCTVVLGYDEQMTVYGDLYVLSAIGTAARIDPSATLPDSVGVIHGGTEGDDERDPDQLQAPINPRRRRYRDCLPCHIPYKRQQAPFEGGFVQCRLCGRRHVPQVILATVDPPPDLDMLPPKPTAMVEAVVCKQLGSVVSGSVNLKRLANAVSLCLPFVEYELHRQLVYKLRVIGCNAVFGLNFEFRVTADHCFVALAQGTACFLSALPQPPVLRFMDKREGSREDEQRLMMESSNRHSQYEELIRAHPRLGPDAVSTDSSLSATSSSSSSSSSSTTSSSSSEDDLASAMALVQVDDEADEDVVAVIASQLSDQSLVQHGTLEYNSSDSDQDLQVGLVLNMGTFTTDPHSLHPNSDLACAIQKCMFSASTSGAKWYRMDCSFVSAKDFDSLLTIGTNVSSVQDLAKNQRMITSNTCTIPGHRTIANYGQIQSHLDFTTNITDNETDLVQRAVDQLTAMATAMGGNAICSVRLVHFTRLQGWWCVGVVGDVVEVVPKGRPHRGSFSSPRETIMIGSSIL